jgi:hypothetical protein
MKKKFAKPLLVKFMEFTSMHFNKVFYSCSVCLLVLIVSGCASSPPLRTNQVISQSPPPQKSIAQEIKLEQRSISVTDIFYKKEGANLKFVEEISTKYDSNASFITST